MGEVLATIGKDTVMMILSVEGKSFELNIRKSNKGRWKYDLTDLEIPVLAASAGGFETLKEAIRAGKQRAVILMSE